MTCMERTLTSSRDEWLSTIQTFSTEYSKAVPQAVSHEFFNFAPRTLVVREDAKARLELSFPVFAHVRGQLTLVKIRCVAREVP